MFMNNFFIKHFLYSAIHYSLSLRDSLLTYYLTEVFETDSECAIEKQTRSSSTSTQIERNEMQEITQKHMTKFMRKFMEKALELDPNIDLNLNERFEFVDQRTKELFSMWKEGHQNRDSMVGEVGIMVAKVTEKGLQFSEKPSCHKSPGQASFAIKKLTKSLRQKNIESLFVSVSMSYQSYQTVNNLIKAGKIEGAQMSADGEDIV